MPKQNAVARADRQKTRADDYHARQIKDGLAQARAGKLLDYELVKAAWEKRLAK